MILNSSIITLVFLFKSHGKLLFSIFFLAIVFHSIWKKKKGKKKKKDSLSEA